MSPDLDPLRAELAAACRALAADRLVLGTAGNVSVRHGDRLLITATGARFDAMTAADVTVTDLDGVVEPGLPAASSELGLHLRLTRELGAGAIVHTHSTMAVAVGCVADELPCLHYQMLLLGGAVPVAPYAVFGSDELAAHVVTALQGKRAALMANHGAVVHAGSLAEAVDLAVLLEWACTVHQAATAMGTPRALDADQQQAVVGQVIALRYGTTRTEGER